MKDPISRIIDELAEHPDDRRIVVLGKGPSLDGIDPDALSGALVINLNDSELIFPGEIAVFHELWVLHSLQSFGLRCRHYLTSDPEALSATGKATYLRFQQWTHESGDLFLHRFLQPELVLEEVLFLTAVKIAQMVARRRGEQQRVYMLGFDFSLESAVYTKHLVHDASSTDGQFRRRFIEAQESCLIALIAAAARGMMPEIALHHVGHKTYSALTPDEFMKRWSRHEGGHKAAKPSSAPITNTTKPFKVRVVAELTNNHLGDLDRLQRMIQLAVAAGADLIKVQKRNVETFYSRSELTSPYHSPFGSTFGDYRRGVELDENGFLALDTACREARVDWFASVLDYPSYLFVKQFGRRLVKLPSTISEHIDFLKAVAADHRGEIVVSTGSTDCRYEKFVLDLFGRNDTLYLLQATSSYPTPSHECSIAVIRHYRDLSAQYPRIRPGYSSHDLGSLGSMLAVAAGAVMIEKHVKLGDTEWIHFDNVAADLGGGSFASFVKDIRTAESMCGSEQKQVNPSEHHKYRVASSVPALAAQPGRTA